SRQRWGNGTESGRYAIAGGADRRDYFLASREEQVKRALRRELAQGLRTWMKVFAEKGYIPTGIGAGPSWDGLSDSGGYAHLISAGAQYLILLNGKRDWELMKVPAW